MKRYGYKVQGELQRYLGTDYTRDWEAGTISASQTDYIDAAIMGFGLENASTVSTPFVPGLKLGKEFCPTDEEAKAEMVNVPYRELLGLLMFIANGTRPDISYHVNILAQVANNPGRIHWEAAKRVVRYLKGTRDYKLTWGHSGGGLVGYSDASHGTEDLGWKSMTGYTFIMFGGAVSWCAKKQEVIALSSAESEYIAMTHASKELIWIRSLLDELLGFHPLPTVLCVDNQSAIAMAKNNTFHPRTKHIALRYHFIREVVARKKLSLLWVDTHSNKADLFTKPLDARKTSQFAAGLGLLKA